MIEARDARTDLIIYSSSKCIYCQTDKLKNMIIYL